ncbi:MAG: universal stress protein, partial [Cohnella sp.]|nr:universal stress protein [Cohnella sp.]
GMNEYEESLIKRAETMISNLPYAEVVVLNGHPATAILEAASDKNCDLILMGSRGLGPVKEFVLGSVSHHVVQHSRVPVLIVK